MLMSLNNYEKFMLESNKIEGEDRLNPDDGKAVDYTLKGIKTLNDILNLHSIVGKYLQESWVGKLRKVNVRVGTYTPPNHIRLLDLMNEYVKDLQHMDSWRAHNRFELIHPFQDLNGRVGRLIWLSKAVDEGYNFKIPFLQAYYYQTLDKYEQGLYDRLP